MSYQFWGKNSKQINTLKQLANSRWLRGKLSILLIVLGLSACIATYHIFSFSEIDNIHSNKILFVLIFDLVILLLITLAIARKLAKLWIYKKSENKQATKLHTRFVILFSLLTITPAIFMIIFAAFMFNLGVQKWFSTRVQTALNESTNVAQAYLVEHKKVIRANVYAMAQDIAQKYSELQNDRNLFDNTLDKYANQHNMDEALVFNGIPEIIARSKLSLALEFEELSIFEIEKAQQEVVVKTSGDRVRALVKIKSGIEAYLLVGRIVDADVLKRIKEVQNAVSNYYEIEKSQNKLQIYLLLVFIAISFLLLLIAIRIAIVFANRLANPIGQLISASEKIRKGELSIRIIPSQDSDEISLLVDSFNRMASKLQKQQNKLLNASITMDKRRKFIEDILSSVICGVLHVDNQNSVQIINFYAMELLNLQNKKILGKNLQEIFPEIYNILNIKQDIIVDGTDNEKNIHIAQELKIVRNKSLYTLNINILKGSDGYIISFVDITALLSAQKKAAWADAARRIAHEIKNPLTPIQLSAEQLKNKYLKQITHQQDKFANCVDTIVRQVSHIGNMVNEFSYFARLPEPIMKEENLVKIIKQHIEQYKGSNKNIAFTTNFNNIDHILFMCDAGQIGQILSNLMQNSIESIREFKRVNVAISTYIPCINITFQKNDTHLILLVEDNGVGFTMDDLDGLTEPYVTTKIRGTGLGLAVVKKIVEEHNGKIALESKENNGALIKITFKF